jgi:hypothetical protein
VRRSFLKKCALEAAIGCLSTVHELCQTLLNGLNRSVHSRLLLDRTSSKKCACLLEANMHVTNGIPLCCSLLLLFVTMDYV